MATDTIPGAASQGFYSGPVYAEAFVYSTSEGTEPLPSLSTAVREAVVMAINCMATIAVTSVVTLTPEGFMASAYSEPVAVSLEAWPHDGTRQRPVDLNLMTERMHQRAGLAARLFQRTPHPGADEPDPDYD